MAGSPAEGHQSFRRGDEIAGPQRWIVFHAQRNEAKRISAVAGAVCRLFLGVAERVFELGVALTVLGDRASNFASEKELGLAVGTDRVAGIFRCSIDESPDAEVLPIAQAHTEADGAAAAATTTHSLSTLGGCSLSSLSGLGHSTG